MESDDRQELTLQGHVMALDWDDEDYPTAVSVMTEDGTEYEVEEGEVGDELLGLEGAEVEVTGLVDGADPEYPTIEVSAVRVLFDPFAEEVDALDEGEDELEAGDELDDEIEPYDEMDEPEDDGDLQDPDPRGTWSARRRAG